MIEVFEKHIAAVRKEYEPYIKALHDIRDAALNVIIDIPKACNDLRAKRLQWTKSLLVTAC